MSVRLAHLGAENEQDGKNTTTDLHKVLDHLMELLGSNAEFVPARLLPDGKKQPLVQWKHQLPPVTDVDHYVKLRSADFVAIKLPRGVHVVDLDVRTPATDRLFGKFRREYPTAMWTTTARGWHLWFEGDPPTRRQDLYLDGVHIGELKRAPGIVYVWAKDGRYRQHLGELAR